MRLAASTILLSALSLAAPALTMAIPAQARTETPKDHKAVLLLGQAVTGPNWTADPDVGTDGMFHQFTLKTPYGDLDVQGRRRLNERFQELRALEALEKTSKSKTFLDAVGNAGLTPIRFGRDLITDPIETTGKVLEGIARTVERVGTEISRSEQSRDGFVASVVGVQKAKRKIAFDLGVDPYTTFKPLADGLDAMAEMAAMGDLSVTAAIAAIPGGAGVAVSATSTAGTLSTTLRDKTSAEIAAQVAADFAGLGIAKPAIDAFLTNKRFTPADQLSIASDLKSLAVLNPQLFLEAATRAETEEEAKFERDRLSLILNAGPRFGGTGGFAQVGGTALIRVRSGALAAVMPYDELQWSPIAERTLGTIKTDITKMGEKLPPILAVTGPVSAAAETGIKAQGWQLVRL